MAAPFVVALRARCSQSDSTCSFSSEVPAAPLASLAPGSSGPPASLLCPDTCSSSCCHLPGTSLHPALRAAASPAPSAAPSEAALGAPASSGLYLPSCPEPEARASSAAVSLLFRSSRIWVCEETRGDEAPPPAPSDAADTSHARFCEGRQRGHAAADGSAFACGKASFTCSVRHWESSSLRLEFTPDSRDSLCCIAAADSQREQKLDQAAGGVHPAGFPSAGDSCRPSQAPHRDAASLSGVIHPTQLNGACAGLRKVPSQVAPRTSVLVWRGDVFGLPSPWGSPCADKSPDAPPVDSGDAPKAPRSCEEERLFKELLLDLHTTRRSHADVLQRLESIGTFLACAGGARDLPAEGRETAGPLNGKACRPSDVIFSPKRPARGRRVQVRFALVFFSGPLRTLYFCRDKIGTSSLLCFTALSPSDPPRRGREGVSRPPPTALLLSLSSSTAAACRRFEDAAEADRESDGGLQPVAGAEAAVSACEEVPIEGVFAVSFSRLLQAAESPTRAANPRESAAREDPDERLEPSAERVALSRSSRPSSSPQRLLASPRPSAFCDGEDERAGDEPAFLSLLCESPFAAAFVRLPWATPPPLSSPLFWDPAGRCGAQPRSDASPSATACGAAPRPNAGEDEEEATQNGRYDGASPCPPEALAAAAELLEYLEEAVVRSCAPLGLRHRASQESRRIQRGAAPPADEAAQEASAGAAYEGSRGAHVHAEELRAALKAGDSADDAEQLRGRRGEEGRAACQASEEVERANDVGVSHEADAHLAILFSGGVDSSLLVALVLRLAAEGEIAPTPLEPSAPERRRELPAGQRRRRLVVELVNVAFTPTAPDRLTGLASYASLLRVLDGLRTRGRGGSTALRDAGRHVAGAGLCTERSSEPRAASSPEASGSDASAQRPLQKYDIDLRLICVDATEEEMLAVEKEVLDLVAPQGTHMDLNIASALYFAARGRGYLVAPGFQTRPEWAALLASSSVWEPLQLRSTPLGKQTAAGSQGDEADPAPDSGAKPPAHSAACAPCRVCALRAKARCSHDACSLCCRKLRELALARRAGTGETASGAEADARKATHAEAGRENENTRRAEAAAKRIYLNGRGWTYLSADAPLYAECAVHRDRLKVLPTQACEAPAGRQSNGSRSDAEGGGASPHTAPEERPIADKARGASLGTSPEECEHGKRQLSHSARRKEKPQTRDVVGLAARDALPWYAATASDVADILGAEAPSQGQGRQRGCSALDKTNHGLSGRRPQSIAMDPLVRGLLMEFKRSASGTFLCITARNYRMHSSAMGTMAPRAFPSHDLGRAYYEVKSYVVLLGSGADELFGGYGRHKTARLKRGPDGLRDEMLMDLRRLWRRNLGRDSRVFSHFGRLPRLPFLDEDLLAFVGFSLPFSRVLSPVPAGGLDARATGASCGLSRPHSSVASPRASAESFLTSCPEAVRRQMETNPAWMSNKWMLRVCALHEGMHFAALAKKRAIQFGSRAAHLSNQRCALSNRQAKGSDPFVKEE
ncbi:hypothetical protein BESB_053750 [Besnoitia besnoiti]|uniref:Asparagine synthetase domain-containing protein n=1 Tax=Besnoitia besnoiti TaxID=94643 RepID=A0A2A9MET6_BESBE|nr:hypothetical protein BESB_053750 [Besnoitia besnoiti]PFH35724.1 hypothetical protein BESB_053750 [Besnoitia besnoiti]